MPKTLAEVMEESGLKSADIVFNFYCELCRGRRPFTATVGEDERGFRCNECTRPLGFMPPVTVPADSNG